MTLYDGLNHIFNKVDKIKAQSAVALMAEYLHSVLPALKKGFTVHIDDCKVCFVSRTGFYPRYFLEVDLDRETVKFNRYLYLSQEEGEPKQLCPETQESGP